MNKNREKLIGLTDQNWYAGLLREERDRIAALAKEKGITPLKLRQSEAEK